MKTVFFLLKTAFSVHCCDCLIAKEVLSYDHVCGKVDFVDYNTMCGAGHSVLLLDNVIHEQLLTTVICPI